MGKYKLFNNILGWLSFLIASTVYLMTIEPTASFWDCGEFISSAYKLEVGHPPGNPIFMLTANLFTQFASSPDKVAMMVNSMSALFSGLTIMFLFWTITHLAKKIIVREGTEISLGGMIVIFGSGLVGALAYTFSDTFWFSAVEGEVYAYSSLFTAVVFWLILKWEDFADRPHADRWIILIAYMMGLSIAVHLLNLLCIPAIVLVYYYKKYPNPTMKGTLVALLISFAIVGLMLYGVIQGLVEVCGWFELLFVNVLGMPYNSGVFAYVIVVGLVLAWAIYETMRDEVNEIRMKIAFVLAITLLGIPFIGSGYVLGIVLIVALTAFMFWYKKINIKALNTVLISLMVIMVGYSSYALILIRSSADTPMNQNAPNDIFTLKTYLSREQYGQVPLFYGQTYVSEMKYEVKGNYLSPASSKGAPIWTRTIKKDGSEKDRYFISRYNTDYENVDELNMLFPRMFSSQPNHIQAYKEWGDVKGEPVKFKSGVETKTVMKPTFGENLRFFFSYQLNFMYWRYFMWNFSGRQNDIQGNGEINNGNWITGIPAVDNLLVGPSDDMPNSIANNKGHNKYYMLPLLLGLIGLFYQAYAGQKGIQSFWITFLLFFMTGIAIVLYLNQTPFQPRERDYAYAGSFYAFCIWVGFGVAGLAHLLQKYAKASPVIAGSVASVLCLLVPVQMGGQNWDDHDRSGRYVARDYGMNYLESCEPNAVIFTNGDNDTFPLWYAQEVEGFRTDVRVCNTSYLQTDWYIDQMKRQAYDSDPLPISWNREDYIQGTRDAARIQPITDQPVDLLTALNWVRTNDPKYKKLSGFAQDIDYLPSNKLVLRVDSAAVINNNVLSDAHKEHMLKDMTIDLSNKTLLGKQELIILDMLQNNNWKRPIYYAITVNPDQFVNLSPFFQQTGMAYQIVPLNTGGSDMYINAERMYDNVMNKFKWGGVDKPGVYLDETCMNQCRTYRIHIFARLASILVSQGEKDKALKVLDKCMEVIPAENVPLDGTALSLAELYYQVGQNEKAEKMFDAIAEDAIRSTKWYFRLKPQQLASAMEGLRTSLYILQEVMQTSQKYNPEYSKKYQEAFGEFYNEYSKVEPNK